MTLNVYSQREPIHYDSSGQPIRITGVAIEQFITPDWVRTQEDFELAVATYVSGQIARGVSKSNIVKYLVDYGMDSEVAEQLHQDVVKIRKQHERKRGKDKIVGGAIGIGVSVGIVAFLFLSADFVDAHVPELVQYALVGLLYGGVFGIFGGVATILHGIYRLVRHIG